MTSGLVSATEFGKIYASIEICPGNYALGLAMYRPGTEGAATISIVDGHAHQAAITQLG